MKKIFSIMFHVKHFFVLVFFLPLISTSQHFGTTKLTVKTFPLYEKKDEKVQQFLTADPNYIRLDSIQREWFYWTNYSRNNPKAFWDSIISPLMQLHPVLQNSYTSSLKLDLYNVSSLPMLKPNSKLLSTSKSLATELAAKDALPSHTSPSGITFSKRMQTAGIAVCAGENISYGPSNAILMLVLLYIDEGVPGLGHRKSLLNPNYVEMGVTSASYSDNNTIVIQDFACKQN